MTDDWRLGSDGLLEGTSFIKNLDSEIVTGD